MKASVEVICYKVRPLKNGEYPLMLRITQSRKRKYVSIGVSVEEKFWDFEKNKPKRNCPNKEKIDRLITGKVSEYNNLIIDLTTEQREYTPETLISSLDRKMQCETVSSFYEHLICKMKKENKLGNAEVYKYSHDSLLNFTSNRLDIQFWDIDTAFLKRYEEWLRRRQIKDTSISQLFRTLRSVYNKAIEENIVKRDHYPFHAYKVSKFDTATQKRAISKEEIRKIMSLDLSNSDHYVRLAQEMFIFSYLGAGINFSDIALLRFGDIKDGRAYYIRKKTGKPINFPLCEASEEIIAKYKAERANSDSDYIFPILDAKTHKTEQQKRDRIRKSLKKINRELNGLAKLANISTHLTTYCARHTFATLLSIS